ncbi:uncharacterized protein LOC143887601 [Tasmannia lanceolata]|uniref:uncharacterized protein LOC143887601 n=1 Tax=Tasmannia lanceolata TaxID=3420 RepID=UPI0040645CE3
MDTRSQAVQPRSYEDFQPSSYWVREEGSDTHLIDLPGFRRDQLKVQIDNSGNMIISGECPLNGNKWSRFRKELRAPDNCNINEIRARFANGTLYVIMPKTIAPIIMDARPTPKQESPEIIGSPKEQKSPKDQGGPRQEASSSAPTTEKQKNGMNKESVNGKQITKKVSWKKEVQSNGSKGDVGKVVGNGMMKEEGAKRSEATDAGKMAPPPPADETSGRSMPDGDKKHKGGGKVIGLDKPRQLIVNLVVSIMVVIALGVYLIHMVRFSKKGEQYTVKNMF